MGESIPAIQKNKNTEKDYRINQRIRAEKVRIVLGSSVDQGSDSTVLILKDAIRLAQEQGLDLVEVGPNQNPPVCRILDYGKFKFSQAKKLKQAKKSQVKIGLKEMRLRMRISQHDIDSKRKQIETFLKEGNKVKISLMLRGRENAYPELGVEILRNMYSELKEYCEIDKTPGMEGRTISMIIAPK
ncbi:MAG: translation initiation factor IF-3 [Chloroflexota bacterium]|nr:translation initiation factor IF-3 [Chloroflexota bacterium]